MFIRKFKKRIINVIAIYRSHNINPGKNNASLTNAVNLGITLIPVVAGNHVGCAVHYRKVAKFYRLVVANF